MRTLEWMRAANDELKEEGRDATECRESLCGVAVVVQLKHGASFVKFAALLPPVERDCTKGVAEHEHAEQHQPAQHVGHHGHEHQYERAERGRALAQPQPLRDPEQHGAAAADHLYHRRFEADGAHAGDPHKECNELHRVELVGCPRVVVYPELCDLRGEGAGDEDDKQPGCVAARAHPHAHEPREDDVASRGHVKFARRLEQWHLPVGGSESLGASDANSGYGLSFVGEAFAAEICKFDPHVINIRVFIPVQVDHLHSLRANQAS